MTRQEMKAEAIKRMKMLNLHPNVIKDMLLDEEILNYSEGPLGGIYWMEETQLERVKEIESKYGCMVYFGILSHTNMGDMMSYLIVSKYDEEWDMEREDIEQNIVFCFVDNLTYPEFSELGSIGIQKIFGGLKRVY